MSAPENTNGRGRRLARPADVTTPFVRARQFLTSRPGDHDGLPVARPTIAVAREVFQDELVLLGFRMFLPVGDVHAIDEANREIGAALEYYAHHGWLDEPEGFFTSPPAPTDVTFQPVRIRGQALDRIGFDSGYEPRPGEPGRERWLSYTEDSREHALVMRHREPRPWVICVHGALMGRGSVDLRLFRARHLHQDLGLNVVLPVLPLHGPRRHKGAAFPGTDVLDDVHATAQAVWDIRRLIAWIRSQEPESAIGLNSMSLGGYIASLVASVEDGLTCAVLGVPVANLIEVLGLHGGLREGDPRHDMLTLAEPLGRMLSPLSMSSRVPMAGRFIYGGLADRLVHPRDQVMRLWEHWDRPEIVWYPGAHTGFFRARPVHDFIDDALRQSGLVAAS
ncbi:hypothetical protein JDV09_25600 [Mycobacterium sp. Y57]|uniref:alpha/beta hydrolase family protein n=1 Tax=Mycolicibacterium xanthum TaxID=2796469 RepID=UPI001C865ECD|nr:hypothetical protein [Mycolicibacterium xanthum]MBX7435443.1 hypothetical protein [Mycolicibacterium xanthum]